MFYLLVKRNDRVLIEGHFKELTEAANWYLSLTNVLKNDGTLTIQELK